MPPDLVEIYREVGEIELPAHVFLPPPALTPRAAIVFFFGGGWTGGTISQFHFQSRRLAERGMVAVCAEYRVQSRHGTSPFESLDDARAAVRWLRAQAARWQIDPARIAAGGGSAGGHLAACTALVPDPEPQEVSSIPNALVLFNPVLDTTEQGYGIEKVTSSRKTEISPCHHVRTGLPPALVQHGTADATVPYENAGRFARLMGEAGNVCRLVPYEGRAHGFFNQKPESEGGGRDLRATLQEAERFLEEIGFLE